MQCAIFVTALIIPERSAFNYERFARKRARSRALSRGRVASYSPDERTKRHRCRGRRRAIVRDFARYEY